MKKTGKHSPCIHEGCTQTFYHRTSMISHLILDHMKEFKITDHSFSNLAEFQACVFDAHAKSRKATPKNKWKWEKGRIPTEMLCPARMLVIHFTEFHSLLEISFEPA